MNEAKQQLEVIVEEVRLNTQRRDNILTRIMEVESKLRYLDRYKPQLQSNPNYERTYIELCNERTRLYKYIAQ